MCVYIYIKIKENIDWIRTKVMEILKLSSLLDDNLESFTLTMTVLAFVAQIHCSKIS